jgi:hypothetical protein
VTTGPAVVRLIVLCEYRCAFAAEPIPERLGFWVLNGPRYSLSALLYASPDGDSDEAWISAEVSEPDAVWRLLDDWSATRRIGARAVAEARGALRHALPNPRRRGNRHRAKPERD